MEYKSIRKTREEMYSKNKICFWCREQTLYDEEAYYRKKINNPLTATVDHILSRYNSFRPSHFSGIPNPMVICCSECNHNRAVMEWEYIRTFFKDKLDCCQNKNLGQMPRPKLLKLFKEHNFHMPLINPHLKIYIFLQ